MLRLGGRRTIFVALLGGALTASGCGSSGTSPEGTASGTRGITTATGSASGSGSAPPSQGYDASGARWFTGPPESAPAEADDAELGPDTAGPVDGPEAPPYAASTARPQDPAPTGDAVDAPAQPCALIDVHEWQSWTGSAQARASVTGDSCLYTDPSDRNRMQVEAFGGPAPLGAAVLASGERVDGVGERATWLPKVPVGYGSTMIAEAKGRTVVIVIFSRDPAHGGAATKDVAQRWAGLAIGAFS